MQDQTPQLQAVITLLGGDDALSFNQQSAEAGLAPSADTVCITNQQAGNSEAFWENVPDGNYCVFTHVGLVRTLYNDRTRVFAAEYMSRTDKASVPTSAMEAYDSLITMADAIDRADSTDPDAVIAAIETTDTEPWRTVNIDDVQFVAGRWGQEAAGQPYDFDSDEIVTVVDIMRVAAAWGPCP